MTGNTAKPDRSMSAKQTSNGCDVSVLIVGGGIMGVSLAYHLAKLGWQDVLLVEKNDLTHGSTWHAAGLCTHFAHNPTVQALRAHSVRLYKDKLPEETGQSCGFHASGAMRITSNADRMMEFDHVAGMSAFNGHRLEVFDQARITELFPLAHSRGLLGGIYEPFDGHVDPTLATQAMAGIAKHLGVTIRRNTAVTEMQQLANGWQVRLGGELLSTTHVVNAAGTWAWEVAQLMGIEIPVVPVLHQYLVTESIAELTERNSAGSAELPMIRDPDESWYVRQERDSLIIGPYEKNAAVWSVDGVPAEFGAELLPPDLDRVEKITAMAIERIPVLGEVGIKSIVNGPITFTPDANPLIGPARSLANAWLMTGSSMGIMEGGGSGWFLAHWMTHNEPPMDALAIDSRRFGAWTNRSYRIDKAVECFGLQFGVHYPFEERPAARPQRVSALHDDLLAAGAVMGVVNGQERANWYASKPGGTTKDSFARSNWFEQVATEVECANKRVALADLSALSKFEIKGPDTQKLVKVLGSNTVAKLGRIGLVHALTPSGGCAAEFTLTSIAADSAYLTSAAVAETADHDLLRGIAQHYDVEITNVTDKKAVIACMGPKAQVILQALGGCSAMDLPWLHAREIELAGCKVLALRISYIGEAGCELHVSRAEAPRLFAALREEGGPFDIGFYGAYAANSMRLEKGYRSWGADLTSERTPLESGLAHMVDVGDRQFTGRDALLARQDSKQRWEMCLLETDALDLPGKNPIDPFYGHTLYSGETMAGVVTSAAFGHRVGKHLALAWLSNPKLCDIYRNGTSLSLEMSVVGHKIACTTLRSAPFDTENERMRYC